MKPAKSKRPRREGIRMGAAISEYRLKALMTMAELATLCGITTRTVFNAENDQPISIKTARAIADKLQIPLEGFHSASPRQPARRRTTGVSRSPLPSAAQASAGV